MKIKVGIIGCASIARRSLAPAFHAHPQYEFKAIGSRSLDKAKNFAGGYEGVEACSYDELINRKDIDLIYCPLPTGLHYEWVRKSLERGKHVLCEKSLACTYDEVSELVRIAQRNNRFLMESFQFRFHPQNLFVKKLIQEKAIGDIRACFVKFGFPPFPDGSNNIRYSASLGGGALLDAGAYTIKAATYLFDSEFFVGKAGRSKVEKGSVDVDGNLWLESPKSEVIVNTAYGFHNHYQCGYEIWGESGLIATNRAFTARPDFTAKVVVETQNVARVESFKANHFELMLDYIASQIHKGEYEAEYKECLMQSKILGMARKMLEAI